MMNGQLGVWNTQTLEHLDLNTFFNASKWSLYSSPDQYDINGPRRNHLAAYGAGVGETMAGEPPALNRSFRKNWFVGSDGNYVSLGVGVDMEKLGVDVGIFAFSGLATIGGLGSQPGSGPLGWVAVAGGIGGMLISGYKIVHDTVNGEYFTEPSYEVVRPLIRR